MHHVDRARVTRQLQVGQPLDGAVTHPADQDGRIGIFFANGGRDAGIELVPIVQTTPIVRVKLFRVPDVQGVIERVAAYFVGIGLNHQVITDDDRVIAVACGGVAPHVHPGILGILALPDGIVEITRIEPVLIPEKGKLTATWPGAEADHSEYVGLGDHGEQAIQIVFDVLIQGVRRSFGEQTGMRDIDVICAQRRQAVKILLGVGRPNGASTHKLGTIQFGVNAALIDIGAAQLGAPCPQRPLVHAAGVQQHYREMNRRHGCEGQGRGVTQLFFPTGIPVKRGVNYPLGPFRVSRQNSATSQQAYNRHGDSYDYPGHSRP